MNGSFWKWAGWAGAGAATIMLLPARYRVLCCVVLLLGGLVYLDRNGGIAGFSRVFTSGGKES